MKRKDVYNVRFRNNAGRPVSFRTTAKSPDVAASKMRGQGTLIRVTKVR